MYNKYLRTEIILSVSIWPTDGIIDLFYMFIYEIYYGYSLYLDRLHKNIYL